MLPGDRWRSSAHTDVGKVRARNEDAFLERPEQGLWVVADGMGGHCSGHFASRLIVDSLAELKLHADFDARLDAVRQCLHWINRRLSQELTITAGQHDTIIGSTVVALLLDGRRAACIWAGDSRCYLWRGQGLYQLSRDHSLLEELIKDRSLSLEQARVHPGARALTRAIGATEQLTLEVLEFEAYPSDVFLLCSDGLYQELESTELGRALSLVSPSFASGCLFEHALRGPARDNLTAVVVAR